MKPKQQQILVLGFFLPADRPDLQKTPRLFKQYARPDQSVYVDRHDNFFVAWDGASLHVAEPINGTNLLDFDVVHIVDWSINEELSGETNAARAPREVLFRCDESSIRVRCITAETFPPSSSTR